MKRLERMNSNLIIILSHCDTEEKLKILEGIVVELKDEGFEILVNSHIPLSTKIQSMVDYLVYDKSNPILFWPDRGMVHWQHKWVQGKNYELKAIWPDYGWTVLNQIKNSSYLGLSLDYTYYTFINYDTVLTPALIEAAKNPISLLTTKVEVPDKGNTRSVSIFPSLLFNIVSKEILEKITPLISKESYIKGRGNITPEYGEGSQYFWEASKVENGTERITYGSAEHFWYGLIDNFTFSIHQDLLKDKITYIPEGEAKGVESFNFNIYNKNFHLHIDNNTGDILVFNLTNPINFKINDNEINISEDYLIEIGELGSLKSFGFYDLENVIVDLLPIVKQTQSSPIFREIKIKNEK